MKRGIVALAMGTFGLGMTEYVMMSILPDLAHDFNVNISQAGHLISAYAIGVCVGAPAVAIWLRNLPLKKILLILMAVYIIGNFIFAASQVFWMGMAGRFIAGLPHGAFFGTGSIVASRLMPDKKTTAVALMTLGMTVANLAGVPVGSFVANTLSWHYIFFFNSAFGVATLIAIWQLVKVDDSMPHETIAAEFQFLKKASPWILIGVTTLCQGGAFAMYSYVSPIMEQAGLALKYIPVFMIVVGLGMCLGNYYSGILSDRFTPPKVACWVAVIMTAALLVTFADVFSYWWAGASITVAAACLFALSSPMQLLLIEYSPGGQLLGGAMVQVAFNLGNAIGAYFGGLPIAAGHPASWASIVGAPMAAVSALLMLWFISRQRNKSQTAQA